MRRNGIPKSLQIGGLTWPVKLRTQVTYNHQACDGLCRPRQQEILLNRAAVEKQDRARKNLLHEALHALFHDHVQYFENEELICILEERLDEFIRLNPAYFALYEYHQPMPGTAPAKHSTNGAPR